MLNKNYKIRKKQDLDRLFKNGSYIGDKYINIKYLNNSNSDSRFVISVAKKISNKATTRNKLRRRIQYIIKKHNLKFNKSLDVLISFKTTVVSLGFSEIENSLISLFKKIKLL